MTEYEDLKFTHLCLVDDLLVFLDGNKQSIEGIFHVFKQCAKHPGLNISFEKSTLYMAGVSEDVTNTILDQFSFGAFLVRK